MVNEYYNEILAAISEHKDFGKRNPIDIGVELGYPEEDIMEMIRRISEASEEEKPGENSNNNEIYFVVNLAQTGEDDVWVISVNIETWKMKKVKKLEGYRWSWGEFDLREPLLVWREERNSFRCGRNKVILCENLKTKEQSKLLTDATIESFKILKTGEILVITTDEFIIWDGKRNKRTYMYTDDLGVFLDCKIIEGDKCIYYVNSDYYCVYKTDEEWNVKELWAAYKEKDSCGKIGVAEYFNERLSWWCYEEETHLFSANVGLYKKFTEGDIVSGEHNGFNGSEANSYRDGVLEAVHTAHYRLLQGEIWSIDDKNKICDFPRSTSSYGNQGQVVAIKDRDIFIALKKGECAIIKVDLQNEKEAVTIPIEV